MVYGRRNRAESLAQRHLPEPDRPPGRWTTRTRPVRSRPAASRPLHLSPTVEAMLWVGVRRLAPRQQEVIRLRFCDEKERPGAEVARLLGVSRQTVHELEKAAVNSLRAGLVEYAGWWFGKRPTSSADFYEVF